VQQLPSAEAWLSKLKAEPRLWKDFVPMLFTWIIGTDWAGAIRLPERVDRAAVSIFRGLESDSVYTPRFRLDGRE